MFPMTVPHTDTVRLSLVSSEKRKFYRDVIRTDVLNGELDEAGTGLWVYLDALDAFTLAADLLGTSSAEIKRRLMEKGLQTESLLKILQELDCDRIPVPEVTSYIEHTAAAA